MKRRSSAGVLLPLALLGSCDFFILNKDDTSDTGEDSSTDTSESDDTGDTSETGDTHETVDTGDSGPDVDCDPVTPAPISGPACVTSSISCGDFIVSTTVGGSDSFDADNYQAHYCLIPYTSYSGPERVYSFILPSDTVATIRLESPCSDLDVIMMQWDDESSCPTEDHLVTSCDADDYEGDGVIANMWNRNPSRYLLIVDGKAEVTDNFALSVECVSARMTD